MDSLSLGDWLEKGLGRAVLRLRETDARPYRDVVRYACTHNQVYDRQCEEGRAPYLLDVIEATGEPGFYRDAILPALAGSAAGDDRDQLLALARLFAQRGDAEAREALYAAFARGAALGDFSGSDELILLDGVDGLMVAAGYLARYTPLDRDDADVEMWLYTLSDRDGETSTWEAFERMVNAFPELRPRLENGRFPLEEPVRRVLLPGERYRFSHAELLNLIAREGRRARGYLRGWGRYADGKDLAQAARDLLAEEDPARLLAFLIVLNARAFPLAPDRLLLLARDGDTDIADAAVWALANLRHPAVRALALELATEPTRGADAAELLRENYQPGDEVLLAQLLDRPMDRDDAHFLGGRVLGVVKAYRSEALVPLLLLLYEGEPCTNCRNTVVEHLLALGRLPGWMREECRWDADLETRELVSGTGA